MPHEWNAPASRRLTRGYFVKALRDYMNNEHRGYDMSAAVVLIAVNSNEIRKLF